MDLSIIIVSFNTKDLLESCIKSIQDHTRGVEYEIIVVDNASKDGSVEAMKSLESKSKSLSLFTNKTNLGFAAANNQGIKKASGKFVLFLNSDTEVGEGALRRMVDWMQQHEKAGVATCSLKNKDGSLQATGGYFPTLPRVFSWMTIQDIPFVDDFIKPFHPLHSRSFFSRGEEFYSKTRQLDWVTGAFLLTRKDLLEKIGGWDEEYFMYVEEVDLCYRIRQLGYEVWYIAGVSIIHLGGASSKTTEFPLLSEYQGIKRFYKKFYPAWQMPFLRFFLKLGALGRVVLFAILEGGQSAKIYAKAFKAA